MKSLFIFLALTICLQAKAEENPFRESLSDFSSRIQSVSDEQNPFRTGTEKVVLTEQDKATLAEYAYNSKTLLERALRKASGKDLEETLDIYVKAIQHVVIDSFADKKRAELLMRYALNQALQLTIGIPTADGKHIQVKGILADVQNKDATISILEDSIRLAIRYYQDDVKAIQSGELVKLPYIAFGNERLALAQNWSNAIHQPELLLGFQVAILEQWMATVANNEVLDRLKIGEAILDVDAALAAIKDSKYSTLQKIRYLRGVTDTLFDTLKRLGYRVAERAIPALSNPEVQEFFVAIDQNEVDGFEKLKLVRENRTNFIMGQGYSTRYYYKHSRDPADKNYKSMDEKEFREFMTTQCAEVNPGLLQRVVCLPVHKIPRSYEYMTNAEFKEKYTVELVIGIYTIDSATDPLSE